MSTKQNDETQARWYMVNKDGMATLCADKADAEKEANDAQEVWPHMGPHRAVQLVEAPLMGAAGDAGWRPIETAPKDGCTVSKVYPLAPLSIGEDTYCVISKGHHDIHKFMQAVRANGTEWPLGVPEHIWMKTVPVRPGSGYASWYEPVKEGTRGAWPCTYVQEAYHDETYEAKFPHKEAP